MIRGNWSPRDQFQLAFYPDWSFESMYWVTIALKPPSEFTSNSGVQGNYAGRALIWVFIFFSISFQRAAKSFSGILISWLTCLIVAPAWEIYLLGHLWKTVDPVTGFRSFRLNVGFDLLCLPHDADMYPWNALNKGPNRHWIEFDHCLMCSLSIIPSLFLSLPPQSWWLYSLRQGCKSWLF